MSYCNDIPPISHLISQIPCDSESSSDGLDALSYYPQGNVSSFHSNLSPYQKIFAHTVSMPEILDRPELSYFPANRITWYQLPPGQSNDTGSIEPLSNFVAKMHNEENCHVQLPSPLPPISSFLENSPNSSLSLENESEFPENNIGDVFLTKRDNVNLSKKVMSISKSVVYEPYVICSSSMQLPSINSLIHGQESTAVSHNNLLQAAHSSISTPDLSRVDLSQSSTDSSPIFDVENHSSGLESRPKEIQQKEGLPKISRAQSTRPPAGRSQNQFHFLLKDGLLQTVPSNSSKKKLSFSSQERSSQKKIVFLESDKRVWNRWTTSEEELALRLRSEGHSFQVIAGKLKEAFPEGYYTKGSVTQKINELQKKILQQTRK